MNLLYFFYSFYRNSKQQFCRTADITGLRQLISATFTTREEAGSAALDWLHADGRTDTQINKKLVHRFIKEKRRKEKKRKEKKRKIWKCSYTE
jgi:muramoyltetrapeptide carboxypeptidase LdcA involved in peptidoglycan recycling